MQIVGHLFGKVVAHSTDTNYTSACNSHAAIQLHFPEFGDKYKRPC